MARLSLVDSGDENAGPLAREVLKAVAAARGRSVDPDVYCAVANHPRALQKMVEFGTVVYFQNSMPPAQRERAYLTASVTNECHHQIPTHVLLGRAAGLTEDKLAHLGQDLLPEGVYEAEEAAIVRHAQRSTRMDAIDDRTYGDLAEHFSQEQIIELCFTVGLSNRINRFHATFLTDVDRETQEALAPSCPLSYPEVSAP